MKLKLYWEFYKSVLFINLFLLIISLVFNPSSVVVNLSFLAIPIIYFYKEQFRKNEYYFYYNMNISKLKLISFCFLLNFGISIIILLINGI